MLIEKKTEEDRKCKHSFQITMFADTVGSKFGYFKLHIAKCSSVFVGQDDKIPFRKKNVPLERCTGVAHRLVTRPEAHAVP